MDYEKLIKVVPPRFKSVVSALPRGGQFSAIVFHGEDVVLSGHTKKALRRLLSTENVALLALGYCFTQEAQELLCTEGFEIVQLHHFHWTDESYQTIRQMI